MSHSNSQLWFIPVGNHTSCEYLIFVFLGSTKDALCDSRCVTLHYDAAFTDPKKYSEYIAQAEAVRKQCGITVVIGRAKKICIYTPPEMNEFEMGTKDELLLFQGHLGWKVTCLSSCKINDPEVCVARLFKPMDAFCHPNPDVMCNALSWILSRIACSGSRCGLDSRVRLLELYCGCGAHTIPIGKSGLVSKVVAVEYDERLVKSCQRNIKDNQLEKIVQVVSEDAGHWAKQCVTESFDFLLVDPPRQGLDTKVLNLARGPNQTIRDIIFISCGKEALLRDLNVLTKSSFEVVNMTLLDLFPGTESVESLVHLRRLTTTNEQGFH